MDGTFFSSSCRLENKSSSSARFPPRDHSLTLSEWFQIHHKEIWDPFIQKEIKMVRHFQMFNGYWYLHRLPEIQLGQFKQVIRALGSDATHTEDIQVDFATLLLPDTIFLPPIHSLVMESSVGPIIFECFAIVISRIKVQKGYMVAFHIFLFREYHQGHVSAEVLAPILEGKPLVSAATFLDMNSIHLVLDPFRTWVERYTVYVAMRLELRVKQLFYPVSIDQFLACASFGKDMVLFHVLSEAAMSTRNLLPPSFSNSGTAALVTGVRAKKKHYRGI
ncbi:hypothetical protein Taro_043810 [Colocasia esculenta]|uniref:Uncharacterized protein n=1 Tax=Colocasia esculenta TaxID=4460 RepID=A0A843WM12_COLES|nr:hypothetical protein [Colocasia esculenta]